MSLPTRHWRHFHGILTSGQSVIITHGVRTGQYPTGLVPDAVEFDMDPAGIYMEAPNLQIGEYAARTNAFVYLSNWDPAARLGAHFYSIIVRSFHSYSGQNL